MVKLHQKKCPTPQFFQIAPKIHICDVLSKKKSHSTPQKQNIMRWVFMGFFWVFMGFFGFFGFFCLGPWIPASLREGDECKRVSIPLHIRRWGGFEKKREVRRLLKACIVLKTGRMAQPCTLVIPYLPVGGGVLLANYGCGVKSQVFGRWSNELIIPCLPARGGMKDIVVHKTGLEGISSSRQ